MSTPNSFKAVFFDIGGVVVGSPFSGIADYEKEHGLPHNYLNVAIVQAGREGAFQKLERGEMDLWTFYDKFSEQLSDPRHVAAYSQYARVKNIAFDEKTFKVPSIDGKRLFRQMMGKAAVVNPSMVRAIAELRKAGYIVAALTNNFNYPTDEKGQREQELILQIPRESTTNTSAGSKKETVVMGQDQLKTLFDYYIESAVLGLRKPDPAIYVKACQIVGVSPYDVVFLDDIGANLKSAQKVGLTTIRVELGTPKRAIQRLENTLGNGIKLLESDSNL